VIEAVFEEIGVKEAVFKELDRVMKPGAILASNTSTLDVEQDCQFHQAPAGRGGPALLQPRQRDEAA
jgi:3-hydroxyacyl-CoA dehydrogenase